MAYAGTRGATPSEGAHGAGGRRGMAPWAEGSSQEPNQRKRAER